MRQSSVVKALLDKERNQALAESVISVLEVRFGEVDDTIKNSLALIQDENTLKYLHRQSEFTDAFGLRSSLKRMISKEKSLL